MATRRKASKVHARKFLRQLYLGCFVSAISIWIFINFYTVPTYFREWQVSSVRVFLYSPLYLSVNDENVVRFALENTQDQVVNATVHLVNGGTVPSFLGSENNVVYSGTIGGHEQINRQLLVFLPLSSNMLGKMAGLGLRGTVGDVSWARDLPIRIAPVPRIQSIGNYLEEIFLAVVASALGIINDILRQFLQSERGRK